MREMVVLLVSFCLGAIPFSFLLGQSVAGTDLRAVGTGTVSATGLYRVAGFAPMAVGGLLDIFKGVPGPLLANGAPVLVAFAACLTVIGHNWSPFIGGSGGRGLSPAIGALLVIAWPGAVLLLASLAIGRLFHHTGLSTFLALLLLPWAVLFTTGSAAALAAWLMVIPILVKRIAGNSPLPPMPSAPRIATHRLIFDNDG
jgi:glycerol-3-phosphate acyltransferase PlsY